MNAIITEESLMNEELNSIIEAGRTRDIVKTTAKLLLPDAEQLKIMIEDDTITGYQVITYLRQYRDQLNLMLDRITDISNVKVTNP